MKGWPNCFALAKRVLLQKQQIDSPPRSLRRERKFSLNAWRLIWITISLKNDDTAHNRNGILMPRPAGTQILLRIPVLKDSPGSTDAQMTVLVSLPQSKWVAVWL